MPTSIAMPMRPTSPMSRRRSLIVLWSTVAISMPFGCALDRLDANRIRAAGGTGNSVAGASIVLQSAGTSATAVGGGTEHGGGAGVTSAVTQAGQLTGGAATRIEVVSGNAGRAITPESGGASGGSAAPSGAAGVASAVSASGGLATGGASGSAGRASTGGVSTSTAGSGVAGNANLPPLHVDAQALGGGRFRLVYDFSDANQLLDWETAPLSNTDPLTLVDGEMAVNFSSSGASGGLALAQFRWPLQVLRLVAEATVKATRSVGGQHSNFYLATLWQGNWDPSTGYGCIFTGRRFFSIDEDQTAGVDDRTFGNSINEKFLHDIFLSATELKWSTNPMDPSDPRPPKTLTSSRTAFYTGAARYLLIGGYESSNRFDDIVIEGVFGAR